MAQRVNASCTACRLAKVKCVYEEDGGYRCKRCIRCGIECMQEKRRSKWDSVQKRPRASSTALSAPTAASHASEQYGELISSLSALTQTRGGASCFRHHVKDRLTELIELAISQNDAATLAWAMGQVASQGFTLDEFPYFQRGDKVQRQRSGLLDDELSAVSPLLSLPQRVSELFAGPLPCVLSIQDDDQPKRYLVNSMCAMSVEELNAAQSPSALWDAMRAHPADAERIFFDAGQEWQRKKESSIHRAREAPLDADLAAAAIDKFGPYLCRMQLSDELVCNGRWELYTMSVYGCATHRGRRHVFCMTFLRVKSKGAAKRRKIETKTGTVGSTSASASLGHDTEYLSEENLRSLVEDLHGSGQADDLLDEFMAAMSDDFAPGEAETDETERRGLE